MAICSMCGRGTQGRWGTLCPECIDLQRIVRGDGLLPGPTDASQPTAATDHGPTVEIRWQGHLVGVLVDTRVETLIGARYGKLSGRWVPNDGPRKDAFEETLRNEAIVRVDGDGESVTTFSVDLDGRGRLLIRTQAGMFGRGASDPRDDEGGA